MNTREFYEKHRNFACRSSSEYHLSPGIQCKFDIIKEYIGKRRHFRNGLDLGCSGNSILYFLNNVDNKTFFDIATLPLLQYKSRQKWNPISGDLGGIPFRDGSFDFVSALDVLEHVKNDDLAIEEMSRVLELNGVALITVPHRMKFYTRQDKIIGHYRRYDEQAIKAKFAKQGLKLMRLFGVYGRLMKFSDLQANNPEKTEESLQNLRERFETEPTFRKLWSFVIKLSSKVMKLDAKYTPMPAMMNIGLIFQKE